MPCCHWVLSVAQSSGNNNTPSWLHRLHAKGGLSFPSHLQIDDLLYGQPQLPPPTPPPPPPPPLSPPPPPPPPASSDRRLALINPQDPPPIPKPPRNPPRPNPSDNNHYINHPLQIQPPPPLSGVISDLFAVPSAPRSSRPPKPFRKQSRPRPRPKDKSASKDEKDKAKAKARKRRRADRDAGVVDGERRSKTEVTVIDTSTDGWKTAKLLIRKGTFCKVRDRKYSEISETEELNKGKRRAGLVAKVLRDKEREKDAALTGNIRASIGYHMKVPDDAIQTVERPKSPELVPGGQSAPILLLPSSSTVSQP